MVSQVEVRIAGRVKSLRSSGAKLKFYDLSEGEDRIQVPIPPPLPCGSVMFAKVFLAREVMCSPQMHEGEDFKEVHANIHRGVSWKILK